MNNLTSRNRAKTRNPCKILARDIKKNPEAYLFLIPFTVIFLVFTIAPVLMSIFLSFTNFNVLEPPEFAGLANYAKMFFADEIFKKAVGNTFLFAAITGPVSYLACVLLAWMLNELPRGLRALMTLVFYSPSGHGR